jgi:hypothetical protein
MQSARRRALGVVAALATARVFAQQSPRPRMLRITVRRNPPAVSASPQHKPHGPAVVDSRADAAGTSSGGARVTSMAPTEQILKVREGSRTLLQFEAAVPMTFKHFAIGTSGVEEVRGVVSYDTLVDFVLRPSVVGTNVTVELEPREGSVLTDAAERGRLATSARGRLGEWIAVGGADLRDPLESRTDSTRARTRPRTDQRGVWLKVEVEPEGTR